VTWVGAPKGSGMLADLSYAALVDDKIVVVAPAFF
jgi:hypothetical protein